ncbi:MAG TPA: amino acid ABC transporter substrate-binding protein [Acidimicrobiales bacterium]|nr:amino acid ABC transporter substrate-binding protein [Acidimicrobiales bacterium]
MHGGISRRKLTAAGLGSLITAGALAGGLVASSAGAADHAAPKAATPITIGVSLSLSGDFSADGQAFQRGYQLWAKDVNRAGGLLGRPVKLDIVSDASSPTQVVTNYQKLISVNHVNLLFGPFSTLLTVPASKIAYRFGYALVEGAGGAPAVFANGLHNVFDVSLPVVDNLVQFAKWIASMPASQRPKTAAYPTSNDPFTEPQIAPAQRILQKAGVKTVYSKVFPAEVTDYTPIADAVAASHAQVVVLGSVDVPTVSSFIQAFAQQHYNPKAFIATGGPDQGAAFVKAVGASNTNGVMVPNGWYPGYANASSRKMVSEYVKQYGGTASGINSDVAEAYSVGQVVAQAVTATKSLDNAKLIAYMHGNHTFSSVQGPVKFDKLGENGAAAAFAFQWQKGKFVQVLPAHDSNSVKIQYPKANWGS